MHVTGTTVLRVENGKIVEEIGLDDGVTTVQQLELLRAAREKERGIVRKSGDRDQLGHALFAALSGAAPFPNRKPRGLLFLPHCRT